MIRFRRAMHFHYAKGAFWLRDRTWTCIYQFCGLTPKPFGPLGDIFCGAFWSWTKTSGFSDQRTRTAHLQAPYLNKKRSKSFVWPERFLFIWRWKILFIYLFDITQFIYSRKTEAAKTKMSCMLSHHIHILITQFYKNLAPRERIELPSFGS